MIGVRVKLTFPEELVRQPVIARMASKFGVVPNIRRANVGEQEGWIICELDGDGPTVDRAVDWFAKRVSGSIFSETSSKVEIPEFGVGALEPGGSWTSGTLGAGTVGGPLATLAEIDSAGPSMGSEAAGGMSG